ncbi:gamma carbonic anhydrase family protein [Natronococcus occultus]|uniref:Isoleucine patch superfamily enzyme, carbonic anhydrase/acetyltransferase n=1 Tax=Natronococcus occultus SP4 TaxID=694430 RepID=L0JWB4_9EURY|nr:gamma carbonic anhydrase family protein [Natronococcus occultus]AGB36605.1 isoleucine patch superfamily enzyme, carbonic anhydrase/acetyltransferase [Natronococcus occultus SP4]
MQRAFEGTTPSIADSAFVSEMAYLIGDVTLEENASVWPFTCLRGDYGPISVGEGSNVQDFTMLHEATVGSGVTIGHNVVIDRATVGDDVLVGISSTILPGATVGDDCIVAAGTLLREEQEVPSGHMAYGAPAEVRPLSEKHREQIRWYCEEYLALSERYRNDGSIRGDGYEDDTQ